MREGKDGEEYAKLLPEGQKFPTKKIEEPVATGRKPLSVGDLKKFISNIPDDAEISLEGCDCVGRCYSLRYSVAEKLLEMERN